MNAHRNWAAEIREIETVTPHPEPKTTGLEIAMLRGLGNTLVVKKGQYQPGNHVLYILVDSILPEWLIDRLGVRPYLAGNPPNRVKMAKLRGTYSEGLLVDLNVLTDTIGPACNLAPQGADFATTLGITKYEDQTYHGPGLGGMSYSVYDLASADRSAAAIAALMDQPVMVTEKLDGLQVRLVLERDGIFHVCSRECEILDGSLITSQLQHILPAVREGDWERKMRDCYSAGDQVMLYGELIGPGIQQNHYKLATRQLRWFDVRVNGVYLGVDSYFGWMARLVGGWSPDLKFSDLVPLLSIGRNLRSVLGEWGLDGYATGASEITMQLVSREGIVIRPMVERPMPGTLNDRLILKHRSRAYRLKHG